jgi:LysM repeat protein
MDKLKKICFILFLLVILKLSDNNIANSNQYLVSDRYQVIDVSNGDSVWSIATKYVTDKDDIRHLIAAIKHINHLDNNIKIYPGQLLKIPIISSNINSIQQ